MGVIIKTRKMIEGAGHLSGLQTTLYNAMIKSITVIKRNIPPRTKMDTTLLWIFLFGMVTSTRYWPSSSGSISFITREGVSF